MGQHPILPFCFKDREWDLGNTPKIMGILNVTPDSFSDGGAFDHPGAAVAHALEVVKAGADIIDIGGESTRPGAEPVSADDEKARVLPVIEAIRREIPDVPLSIDTRKPEVADAALTAGADIVNDISGFASPDMRETAAKHRAGCIVMHMRATPENMQQHTGYADLIGEICTYFRERITACNEAGIDSAQIVLDPGIGFSKTAKQNLELIADTRRFRELGRPVLMGPSRKSFIGKILDQPDAKQRVWGTAGAIAICAYEGADIIRVHDVREMREAALVAAAIRDREIRKLTAAVRLV